MAKKKSESGSGESKPAAKKAPATKAAPKPAATGGTQMVDTSLVAQNAAKLLVAGLKKPSASGSGTAPQSKLFQQIKTGQSSASAIGGILDKGSSHTSKPNQPMHCGNIKGHKQTFGSDASKAFVPRRTSGG